MIIDKVNQGQPVGSIDLMRRKYCTAIDEPQFFFYDWFHRGTHEIKIKMS